jgi:hypothetical protein
MTRGVSGLILSLTIGMKGDQPVEQLVTSFPMKLRIPALLEVKSRGCSVLTASMEILVKGQYRVENGDFGGCFQGLTSSVLMERGSHDYSTLPVATTRAVPYPVSLVSKPIDRSLTLVTLGSM